MSNNSSYFKIKKQRTWDWVNLSKHQWLNSMISESFKEPQQNSMITKLSATLPYNSKI